MSFTNGPWRVRDKTLGHVYFVDAGAGVLAQVCSTVGDDGTDLTAKVRNDANARLIAAAPELLDLLREAWLAVPITQHNTDLHTRIKALIQRIEVAK
jgi:hypothetical protein